MSSLVKATGERINFYGTNYQVPWEDVAHQGLGTSTIPLNTLPAFYTAYLDGATSIEFDVRQTSDGELIISHDATVNSTTIATTSWDTIKAIVLATDDTYGQIRVPTLDETLTLCCYYNLIPVIHIYIDNTDGIEKIIKTVLHHGLSGKCIYNLNSYSGASIITKAEQVAGIDKKAMFQFAYNSELTNTTYNSIVDDNSRIYIAIYKENENATKATFDSVKEMGYKTYLWGLYNMSSIMTGYSYKPDFVEYGDNIYVNEIRENYLNNLNLVNPV